MEGLLATGLVGITRVTITGVGRSGKSKNVAVLSTKPVLTPSFSATVMLTTGNGKRHHQKPNYLTCVFLY